MITDTKPINCFSPEYVSQIRPFKGEQFKLPALEKQRFYPLDNIAPSEEGKRARLLKANI